MGHPAFNPSLRIDDLAADEGSVILQNLERILTGRLMKSTPYLKIRFRASGFSAASGLSGIGDTYGFWE
jgi:hypothetical protein